MLVKIKKLYWLLSRTPTLIENTEGVWALLFKFSGLLMSRGLVAAVTWAVTVIANDDRNNPVIYQRWIKRQEGRDIEVCKTGNELLSISIVVYSDISQKMQLVESLKSINSFAPASLDLALILNGFDDAAIVGLDNYLSKSRNNKVIVLERSMVENPELLRLCQLIDTRRIVVMRAGAILNKRSIPLCRSVAGDETVDCWYSDHDVVDSDGVRFTPNFKPDFSIDLLRTHNYFGLLIVTKPIHLRDFLVSSQSSNVDLIYGLILGLTEKRSEIEHISQVVYHQLALGDDEYSASDVSVKNELLALNQHLERVYGGGAYAEMHKDIPDYFASHYPNRSELVSIIIPTKDQLDLLEACIRSIIKKTEGIKYEIIIIDNGSVEQKTIDWLSGSESLYPQVSVVTANIPFNWARLNNIGIGQAEGEVFVFLNNDTEVISSCWLQRLASLSLRSDVGAVGGLLLYGDGTVQHAGVVIGYGGFADHIYSGALPERSSSPFVSPLLTRNVLANTGACLAISRETISQIGEFDESFAVIASDVEISLRAYQRGLVNIYDPGVLLYHHESKTRDASKTSKVDQVRAKECYQYFVDIGDPFYNPNLSLLSKIPMLEILD